MFYRIYYLGLMISLCASASLGCRMPRHWFTIFWRSLWTYFRMRSALEFVGLVKNRSDLPQVSWKLEWNKKVDLSIHNKVLSLEKELAFFLIFRLEVEQQPLLDLSPQVLRSQLVSLALLSLQLPESGKSWDLSVSIITWINSLKQSLFINVDSLFVVSFMKELLMISPISVINIGLFWSSISALDKVIIYILQSIGPFHLNNQLLHICCWWYCFIIFLIPMVTIVMTCFISG